MPSGGGGGRCTALAAAGMKAFGDGVEEDVIFLLE